VACRDGVPCALSLGTDSMTTRRTFLALATASAAVSLVADTATTGTEPMMVPDSGKTRSFSGIYTAEQLHGNVVFDIEVRGVESQWMVGGRLEHVYELEGRKAPFVVRADRPLRDTEVLDQVFTYLVERAKAQPGILGQMAAQGHKGRIYPLWLFRTSVLGYRVSQRRSGSLVLDTTRLDHTDEDFAGLIEAGKIGPVV